MNGSEGGGGLSSAVDKLEAARLGGIKAGAKIFNHVVEEQRSEVVAIITELQKKVHQTDHFSAQDFIDGDSKDYTQRAISVGINKKLRDNLMHNTRPAGMMVLESMSSPSAWQWLNVAHRMDEFVFRVALFRAFGLSVLQQILPAVDVRTKACGIKLKNGTRCMGQLDGKGRHVTDICKRDLKTRHDQSRDHVIGTLRAAGHEIGKEVLVNEVSEMKMDIVNYSTDSGDPVYYDITYTSTTDAAYYQAANGKRNQAKYAIANRFRIRDNHKKNKYQEHVDNLGGTYTTLVMDTCGAMGKEMHQLFSRTVLDLVKNGYSMKRARDRVFGVTWMIAHRQMATRLIATARQFDPLLFAQD